MWRTMRLRGTITTITMDSTEELANNSLTENRGVRHRNLVRNLLDANPSKTKAARTRGMKKPRNRCGYRVFLVREAGLEPARP